VIVQRNADGTLSMECVRGVNALSPSAQGDSGNKAGSKSSVLKSEKPAPKPVLEEKE
jgi:hypothetical protein